jgi:hypothetical protein
VNAHSRYDRWWATLSDDQRRQALTVAVGTALPTWMVVTLDRNGIVVAPMWTDDGPPRTPDVFFPTHELLDFLDGQRGAAHEGQTDSA